MKIMEDNVKKLFEYLREIYKLKTKVVLDYKKFDATIELEEFKKIYSNIADIHEFSSDISAKDEYFAIKYINVKSKEPKVPKELEQYTEIKDEKLVLITSKEIPNEIEEMYNQYLEECIKTKKVNELIDKYNSLYEYFYDINRRKNEFEEKIEILLGKGLFIYKTQTEEIIRRHVFEVPLNIEIDQDTNTIYLRINKENKPNLEYNFLYAYDFKIKDRETLSNLKNEYQEKYLDGEVINFEELYKQYLNSASLKWDYINENEEKSIENEKAYIFNKDSIIVRKKQPTVWMDDLNTIVSKIENNNFKTQNMLPYLIVEKDEEKINELLHPETIDDSLVLFPLESNEEQYKVVNQTKNSNLVLVQGPPGTGKSHTIANLISNYVAEGKRVLVTSEKSKALEVIKYKLPEQIRNLSMTLLGDIQDSNELSNSIQMVLDKYKDKEYLSEYEKKIKELEEKLTKIINEKNINHEQIIQILLNNTRDYKNEVYELSGLNFDNCKLVDIAKYLSENKNLDYIIDNNNFSNIFFNKEALMELNTIAKGLEKYKEYIFGREYELPHNIDLNSYEISLENINNLKVSDNINGLMEEGIDGKKLDEYDITTIEKNLNNVITLEKIFTKKYIKENTQYKPLMNNLKRTIDECKNNKEFFEKSETETIGNNIEVNSKNLTSLEKALSSIYGAYTNDGKISFIEKIKYNKEIQVISSIVINGNNLGENITEENLKISLSKVRYMIKVAKIKKGIVSVFREGNLWNIVNENEFSRTLDELVGLLITFEEYTQITNGIKKSLEEIFRTNVKILGYIKNEEYEKISSELIRTKEYDKFLNSKQKYESSLHALELASVKTYDTFKGLILALREKNLNNFRIEKEKIENIYIVDEKYNEIKNKYANELNKYPLFIERYISMDEEQRRNVVNNFDEILNYYKLKMFFVYQENDNKKFNELIDKKDEIEAQKKQVIINLIEQKSWYNQINSMTNTICKSLAQWLSLKTKLGKGTGKRANIIRREMQEQMQIAKNAIPIWIMPLDKVIEQYPYADKPQFDVIIMDESSQSSILSITALLRGKKMIIVGDDKQISPISVGISTDNLKALQTKYLNSIGLGVAFDMDMSIYDLAQNLCSSKKVVLKEHFRCLPEIIEFSNQYFYGGQINCLKVRSKENTTKDPIKTYYLESATVNDESSNYLVNTSEVDKIIEILKEIENDQTYINKDIGVIVLQNSSAQIKAINTAIWQNFSSDFIKNRRIKIGNSYEFQGDERDVIILSMVISKKMENGDTRIVKALTTKEYERSFNVAASRAKEQVILVHSIAANELSKECLRYKLITYYNTFNNNKKESDKINLVTEFEKSIYNELKLKNISIIPHFKIGKYDVDFVVNDQNGKKIGIECDGDIPYTREEFENEITKQDVLTRCGWKFIRVRASMYYSNKEDTLNQIIKKIHYIINE